MVRTIYDSFDERFTLKKTIFLLILVFGLAVFASAQTRGPGRGQRALPPSEAVTASGNLIVAHGLPAIRSGDTTYLVLGLNRLVGFVDGLREGAHVTVEGRALTYRNDNNLKFLRPATLTLGGRNYDLAMPEGFDRFREQFSQRDSWRNQPHRFPHGRPHRRTL